MAAVFCLWGNALTLAQDEPDTKGAKGISAAAIFVKGHYVYLLDAYVTDAGGTNSWLHILDIEDDSDIEECAKIGINKGRDVFVTGDYMYVITDGGLIKFDVSDPCDPDSLGFGQYNVSFATDLYVTDDLAYVASDNKGVFVWDLDNLSAYPEWWPPPSGSPQGIHVRGPYAYIACEALTLWIRDMGDSTNYTVDTTDWSYDVYNVGLEDTNRALTYVGAGSHIWAWETTDPEDLYMKGSADHGGPVCQSVHVTGDWVYRLGSSNKVEVYPLEYDGPDRDTTFAAPALLYDFHVIHEHYKRGQMIPIYGSAHIFGAYRDSDTLALWVYNPSPRIHRVNGFTYGDVNEDGNVNLGDVVCLINYTSRGYNGSVTDLDAADVNCDGEINTYDVEYLCEYLWGGGPAPGLDCDFYNDW
jgi:hypothetical protein